MRLFTFGCSFTRYDRWPTWADILAQQTLFFENWAIAGSGNSLIFNSIIECHQRNQLTKDDQVYVMWTNTSREDRYVGNRWLAQGNVYWLAGNELPLDYIKKFTCERGYIIRDLATITAAKHFLDHIGCKYKFFSMVPLNQTTHANDLGENPDDNYLDDNSDVFDLYQDTLDYILPSMYETVFNSDWTRPTAIFDERSGRADMHPTPLEHLKYLDHVLPDVVKEQSRKWANDWETISRANPGTWVGSNFPKERL